MSEDDQILDRLDQVLPQSDDPLSDLARLLAAEKTAPTIRPLDLKGMTLDGYRLQRLLGVGGMGATYRAISAQGEPVAVKVAGQLSAEAAARFEAEAEALRQLDHPGIVGYRGHGMVEGYAYLVMDLLPGEDLQKVLDDIDEGRTTEITAKLLEGIRGDPYAASPLHRRVARIFAQVADALQVCHEAGVVHRDIKPANILLRPDLQPVLIDFGFSRDLFRSVSLTRSSVVLGTVGYMAPEQLHAKLEKVTGRTDIFSFGLVFYRCLTGRDLRDDYSGIFAYHRKPLLLPRDVARRLPVSSQHVLYGCLEPRPEKRYVSARDLAKDLRATVTGAPTTWRRPGAVRRFLRSPTGRWASRLATVLFVVVAIWLAWFKPWTEKPHLVTVDAMKEGGRLVIDGVQVKSTPLIDHPLSPGVHTLEYTYPSNILPIRRTFTITKDRRHYRWNLLTISTDERKQPSRIQEEFFSPRDPTRVLLRLATGSQSNALFLDERPIESGYAWVAPGKHRLSAQGPEGQTEVLEITLPPAERADVFLLPHVDLTKIPATFRWTLQPLVVMEYPDDVLRLDDGLVPFLNDAEEPFVGEDLMYGTSISPVVLDQDLTALLHVDFGGTMRSVAAHWFATHRPQGGELRVEYRTEGMPWSASHTYPGRDGLMIHHESPGQIPVREEGTRWFELRGTMRLHQRVGSWSHVTFLPTYLGSSDHTTRHAGFQIIADPDPERAVLRKPD